MTSASKSPETVREEAANVLLSQVLRDQGLDARAEIRSKHGTPDVRVKLRSGDLGQIGPDRRDLWDGFERTDAVTAYPMVENHDTEQRRSLLTEPDKNTLRPSSNRVLAAI